MEWKSDRRRIIPGSLWRMVIEGEKIKSTEELFTDSRIRIRNVVHSPAGKLYVLSDDINGRLLELRTA